MQVPKECLIEAIMAAAAPLAGLDPASEQFVPVDLGSGLLQASFLPKAYKVGGVCVWRVWRGCEW